MIYLVTQLFTSVTIVKPSTSHSSNSEVYIILKKYKGIDNKTLEILYTMLDDPKITSKTLLFSQIDMLFFKSYIKNIESFIDRQIQSLSKNYYYYYHSDEVHELHSTFEKYVDDWLEFNPIN